MMWTGLIATLLFPGLVMCVTEWEHHVLVYNFMDTMAQSTCTALAPDDHVKVWAVRHDCKSVSITCEEVCDNVRLSCDNSLYVYKEPRLLEANPVPGYQPDAITQGLSIQRFISSDACGISSCGPNYCCCYESADPIHPL